MNRLMQDDNQRERIIRHYIEALEAGDLDAQDRLLTQAAAFSEEHGDRALEATLWEAQVAIGAELEASDVAALAARERAEAGRILGLAQASFTTPAAASRAELQAMQEALDDEDEAFEEQEPPPLTLREVAARLRLDTGRMPSRLVPAARDLVARLETQHGGVPVEGADLSERGARSLLGRLGLGTAGSWLVKQFHEALLSLQVSREKELRLAAARRSHARRRRSGGSVGPGGLPGETRPEEDRS